MKTLDVTFVRIYLTEAEVAWPVCWRDCTMKKRCGA
jgi:hypothetical protein